MTINHAVASLLRILLVSAFFIPPGFAQQPQPTPQGSSPQTDKIESKIRRIGVRADVTVKLHNGKTYHGFINHIDDEQFEVSEVDLKTTIVVRYDEVERVESGYGQKGLLGNRVGKKGRRVGLIIGLAAIAIPLIIVASTIED
jgi:hypothetical protein